MIILKNHISSSLYTSCYCDWTRCKIVASQTSKEECCWDKYIKLERIDEIESNKRL